MFVSVYLVVLMFIVTHTLYMYLFLNKRSELHGKIVCSWCDESSDQSFMVDPLRYFSFQPVLHDWCNKGCGMCYPVCANWYEVWDNIWTVELFKDKICWIYIYIYNVYMYMYMSVCVCFNLKNLYWLLSVILIKHILRLKILPFSGVFINLCSPKIWINTRPNWFLCSNISTFSAFSWFLSFPS